MSLSDRDQDMFFWRLRRMLPLKAHARPPLLGFLREHGKSNGSAPCLKVTNIFRGGDGKDVLCQFLLIECAAASGPYVAPLSHLTFGRNHPITRCLSALPSSPAIGRKG